MDTDTFAARTFEEFEKLSFLELYKCLEEDLRSLLASVDANLPSKESYDKLTACFGLLGNKLLDGLISENQRVKFIKDYCRKNPSPTRLLENKINKLKKKIRILERNANQVKSPLSEKHIIDSYLVIRKIIDVQKFSSLFVRVSDIKEYVVILNEKIPIEENIRTELNPNLKIDGDLNKLFKSFVEVLPIFFEQAIKKTNAELLSNMEDLEKEKLLPDNREKLALEVLEKHIKFEFKQEITERSESIVKLRSKRKKIFGQEVILPFEIFPIGEWGRINTGKRNGFAGLSANNIKRLEKIREIYKPDRWARGRNTSESYRDYWVFLFDGHDKVIAENPNHNNATYIIKGSWDEILEILKLPKSSVMGHHQARRVIHNNEPQWLNDLRLRFHYWH